MSGTEIWKGPIGIFGQQPTSSGRVVASVEGLSVKFGALQAVDDLNLEIEANATMAIIGPNGSGKTTVLNALSGLNRTAVTTGKIQLMGTEVVGRRADRIARLGIGRSFQDPQLIVDQTVEENLLCGAQLQIPYGTIQQLFRIRRVRLEEIWWRCEAKALLEFAGIGDSAWKAAGSLSYGTRKLVDVARALISSPKILLLDEPASGLDAEERKVLTRMLRELAEAHCVTVVMVEHDLDVVGSVASRVVGMQGGRLLVEGTPEEVLQSEKFRSALIEGEAVRSDPDPGMGSVADKSSI